MVSNRLQTVPRVQFSFGELSGALGDSITVLPLVVAIGALSDHSIGMILLGFGLFQIWWGVYYGAPVSVEPMKALAALVIAGGLSSRAFAIAGLLAGVVLLLVGATRTLDRIRPYLGRPVIRGVQLAVALLLLETGLQLAIEGPSVALLAAGAVVVLLAIGWRNASPLVVLALGALWTLLQSGPLSVAVPTMSTALFAPGPLALGPLLGATAGQLAMTVGNAAVATSLLLSEYFDAEISPDELATSMGVMNLVAVPLGMIPMCHGSGGVAGKYTFGAETAGSNLILGVLYLAVTLFATGIVMAFPLALLGVVLVLIALQLGRTSIETDQLGITVLVGVASLATNIGVGFLVGLTAYLAFERYRRSAGEGLTNKPSE